jgi:hypothetical protein
MTTLVESELTIETARERHRDIVRRRQNTRAQIDTVKQAIADGDERLVELRAQEIISGRPGGKHSETVSAHLMTQRQQLRSLEMELRALELAEKRQAKEVERLEQASERQAAERLYADIERSVRKLDDKLHEVRKLNDDLLILETQLRESGLAEVGVGGKALVLLARSGIAWNALSPTPIRGVPIHFESWQQNMRTILGE